MSRSIQALINPAILSWARALMGLDLDYVAQKAKIAPDRLVLWEAGGSRPTVAQLRKLARIYRFPIAVFYLPDPPDLKIPHPRDRRFLLGFEQEGPSPELSFEFRWAHERRQIAFESCHDPPVGSKVEYGCGIQAIRRITSNAMSS